MNNYSKIYWLTRLDNIQEFCITILVLSIFTLLIYYIVMALSCFDLEDRQEFKKNFGKYKTTSFWSSVIVGLLLVFMPSKNDMILIYAGGKTMDYVQSDTLLSKIPYQTTSIISKYLDNSIKQMENKNNK